jgi:hydroxypyruvate isomerase
MKMNRRNVIKRVLGAAGIAIGSGFLPDRIVRARLNNTLRADSELRSSVCKWCYPDIPLEQLCEAGVDFGLQSVELLDPDEWGILKKYNMTCAMSNGSSLMISRGFNNPAYHDQLKKDYSLLIEKAADSGIEKIVCFSGNRDGLSDKEGLENCLVGLDPVIKHAEKKGVVICMEPLNSVLDHPDYQCDSTEWAVELAKRVDSENFKILYDIYHMQIMEGNVIATIRKYSEFIAHYHTGGVPGRNEIDESQELNYPAICRAIAETGFQGFIGQEFIPKSGDPIQSLRQGIEICTV